MKIIVIPDIHNHVYWIENFLKGQKYDKVIFLGDYFDDFDDTHKDAEITANWLKNSLTYDNRIHLWGNHDLDYCYPKNLELWCVGFTDEKCKTINSILKWDDWKKMKYFHIN